MCPRKLFLFAAIVMSCVPSAAPPAKAQSFFQALFGYTKKPSQPKALRYSTPPKTGAHSGFGYRGYEFQGYGFGTHQYHRPISTRYKTYCVRTCDGFYFPVRSNTSRKTFYEDGQECSKRCGSQARLFYLPRHSSSIENMTDLTGRRYASLKNAFYYRKKLKAGCTCQPEPWSARSRARHRYYAYLDDLKKIEAQRAIEVASLNTNVAAHSIAEPVGQTGNSRGTTDKGNEYVGTVPGRYVDEAPLKQLGYARRPATAKKKRRLRKPKRKKAMSSIWSLGGPQPFSWPGEPPSRSR